MIFDIGYGLTALGYTALLLLLFTVRKPGTARYLLTAAVFTMVLWSLAHISYVQPTLGQEKLLFYDAIRQSFWILFIAACLKGQFDTFWSFLSRPVTLTCLIIPVFSIIATGFQLLPPLWLFCLLTLNAIQALVLTELVYRQASEQRWAFKPLVIYLGVIFLLDFVTYANALMLNTLSWDFFAARGYLAVVLLPVLVIAVRRIKHWGIEIFVSRDIVLHSTLLLLAGIYLLVMAVLGYMVKFIGGSWSSTIQLILVVISLVMLLSLLMSHHVRTKLKVFITKHFYANQYDYREEWVKLTKTLSEPSDDLNDTYRIALKGWVEGIGYNHGILYKITNDRPVEVANYNDYHCEKMSGELLHTLVEFFGKSHWIIDRDELSVKPEVYEGLNQKQKIIGFKGYQLYIPLVQADKLWGFVALAAMSENKKSLNWELRDYINAITEQISGYVVNAEASILLAENAQFAAFNRMSAFVVHDLKNVLAQINLILSNAKEHKDNPEFIADTFETLEYTQGRMDKMLRQLMQKNTDSQLKENQLKDNQINLKQLVQRVVDTKCQSLAPLPVVSGDDDVHYEIDDEKLSNVIYHLISNAQQATDDHGDVQVEIFQTQTAVCVRIADNGEGMSESFIQNRLYKPFDTTKGNAGMGIGAYDAKQFVEENGGTLSVTSSLGEGSEFLVELPK